MSEIDRFNIRVYGIYINDKNEVLLSTEWIMGEICTKFPGGGLEFGEGTKNGLKREFQEEMACKIEVLNHLYTTDYFVKSAFRSEDQLISIYYTIDIKSVASLPLTDTNDPNFIKGNQKHAFHFHPVQHLTKQDLSFPVDRHLLPLIKNI